MAITNIGASLPKVIPMRIIAYAVQEGIRKMAETVTLKTIMAFFGMSPAQMTKEWKALTDKDKADIKSGLENGSLTY